MPNVQFNLTRILLAVSCLMGLLGGLRYFLVLNYQVIGPFGGADLFDIGGKNSIQQFWSICLWLCCACLCLAASATGRERSAWIFLSIGSMGVAIDESCQIHERLSPMIGQMFGVSTGVFAAPWVIVAIPIVIICGLVLLPFLIRLERPIAIRLVIAGALFVGGAVGLEMAFAPASTSGRSAATILTLVTAEETLEMLGASLFAGTVAKLLGGLNVRFTEAERTSSSR